MKCLQCYSYLVIVNSYTLSYLNQSLVKGGSFQQIFWVSIVITELNDTQIYIMFFFTLNRVFKVVTKFVLKFF